MPNDIIIIGGGLSGLTAGIALQRKGRRVTIATSGPSTLNTFSGSLELFGYDSEDHPITHPLEAIADLPATHPYSKIGAERVAALAQEAQGILREAGISLKGDATANHWRITPMGVLKPVWLTLDDCLTSDDGCTLPSTQALIINIAGFLDFPIEFIRAGLDQMGVQTTICTLPIKTTQARRSSQYETRATTIARMMDNDETLRAFAEAISAACSNSSNPSEQMILLPAVFGLTNDTALQQLRSMISHPVYVIATLPPSLLGVRLQTQLRNHFTQLGGTILHDAKVTAGTLRDNKIVSIATGYSETMEAHSYIIATGSFQSHGLVADYRKVAEPIFGLDIDANIKELSSKATGSFFEPQPFMTYGVHTDSIFHPFKNGHPVSNLYAIGSLLSGHNTHHQSDGTGVSMLTALAVAEEIDKNIANNDTYSK